MKARIGTTTTTNIDAGMIASNATVAGETFLDVPLIVIVVTGKIQ